jgi:hypothetical protein
MNTELYNFYCHKGTDAAGRTFDDIMAFNDEQLEKVHDYIQWIFPSLTPSGSQPQSPILDEETISVFKQSYIFSKRFHDALIKIFHFWNIPVIKGESISTDDMNTEGFEWLLRGNHNQLRISRVLESTRLLGYKDVTRDLFNKLVKFVGNTQPYQHQLTAKNIAYWYQAASGVKIIP